VPEATTKAKPGKVTPGQPRSEADRAALARFSDRMALPIVLAAVLPLFVLPDGDRHWLAIAVNVVAWIVFVVDFVVHERRLRHYLGTWLGRFDLTVVVLTAPWFLVMPTEARFVMLIRLARVARVVMATRGARKLFERLGRVALVAVSVTFLGAAVVYRAEHPVNPEFATYGDSLWWATVTLTTVGYGDIVPETTSGRVVAAMIMVTGVAILGLLAGSLASFFRLDPTAQGTSTPTTGDPAGGDPVGDALSQEVAALREQVALLGRIVGSMPARGDPDPPDAAVERPAGRGDP
jgi:voltage-gated potassium channel